MLTPLLAILTVPAAPAGSFLALLLVESAAAAEFLLAFFFLGATFFGAANGVGGGLSILNGLGVCISPWKELSPSSSSESGISGVAPLL